MRTLGGGAALLCMSALALAAAAALGTSQCGALGPCGYVEAGLLPDAVSMMVEDDRIVRFDVSDPGAVGPFGIRVGDSEAAARARLPSGYRVQPHKYGRDGGNDLYLTWRDPQGELAVRYETGEGTVTSIYWGSWDAVQLVEGGA
jgi:hypothetical protein